MEVLKIVSTAVVYYANLVVVPLRICSNLCATLDVPTFHRGSRAIWEVMNTVHIVNTTEFDMVM